MIQSLKHAHNQTTIVDLLFVCLGNICRSPLAEGIAHSICQHQGRSLNIASAGTGRWHVGEPPHRESQAIAQRFGIDISRQRARHLSEFNLLEIPYICVMDYSNYQNVLAYELTLSKRNPPLMMMRFFENQSMVDEVLPFIPTEKRVVKHIKAVPDPYYGNGPHAFLEVYQILQRSCQGLLNYIDLHQR
jgi:protein-tyrosine phosphatase